MSFDTRVKPDKYCAKHKQRYHVYLKQCPICRGEAMDKDPKTLRINQNGKTIDDLFK